MMDRSDDAGSQDADDVDAEPRRVERRRLSREERRQLDEKARPGAVYREAGWSKKAREDLHRIERAVDELDAPGSGRAMARKRRAREGSLPAGLRSRINETMGPIAYVQLSYSTKRHHVCHVGRRLDDGIEDVIVLVGPDGIRRFDEVQEAIDGIAAPAPSTPTDTGPSPFGRVYEIEEIEGVGEVYREGLAEVGIHDTEALWRADPEALAEELDVSAKVTRRWHTMAELMAISGIGPQYAELLVRSGVESIEALASTDADELLDAVQAKQESLDVQIQGNKIQAPRVDGWIQAARTHDTEDA